MSSNLIKLQAWSKSEHQEGGSRDRAQGIRPTAALKAMSRVSAIAPPSTPTNTNMSTQSPSRVHRISGSVHLREAKTNERNWVDQIQRILRSHRRVHQRFVSPRVVRNSMLRERDCSGQHPNSAVVGNMRENRKSATSATAKSILYKMKEMPNIYPPLRPIAEHLWHVLDNCEVWPLSPVSNPQPLRSL